MDYFASHASVALTLGLRDPLHSDPGPSILEERSALLPASRVLVARGNMLARQACGTIIDVTGQGRAWHSLPAPTNAASWPIWGSQTASKPTNAHQPDCTTTTAGYSPAPQTGGTLHCTTKTVDHYLYYPDTGVVEYQYSTASTVCEYQT
jgi:hypothetical protein